MDYIIVLDSIGIIAFTLTGYILAAKMRFDILGIIFISLATAFGGGVIRDVLVGRVPFIFQETYPLTIALTTVVVAYIRKLHNHTDLSSNKIFLTSDSIGMSTFAITGSLIAIEYNFNLGGIVFLSLLTAVGGSIVRDVIMNETPYFLTNEFYGTIAIIIGVFMWGLSILDLLSNISIVIVLMFGFILRLIAIKYKWKLPSISND